MKNVLKNRAVIHQCDLHIEHDEVDDLPPNASNLQKLRRYVLLQNNVNINNLDCKHHFKERAEMVEEQKRHAGSGYKYMIHPFSNSFVHLERFTFLSHVSGMFLVPFTIGFEPPTNWLWTCTWVIWNFLFVIKIITSFLKGYVSRENEIVTQPKRVALLYLKTFLIFDLIVLVVFVLQCIYRDIRAPGLDLIYFFTKVKKTNRLFLMCSKRSNISFSKTACITYIWMTFVIVHLFSCGTYYIPIIQNFLFIGDFNQPIFSSWLKPNQYRPTVSLVKTYLEIVRLTAIHFFGVGIGDYPHYVGTNYSQAEELYLSTVLIVGRIYTVYIWADLLVLFGVIKMSEIKYQEIFDQLIKFIVSQKLPSELRHRLCHYYEYKFQGYFFNEKDLMSIMPKHLQEEIHVNNCRILIQKTQQIRNLTREAVGLLISRMRHEIYLTNDVIYKDGDFLENIYFISFGTVAFFTRDGIELGHKIDGEYFGMASMICSEDGKYILTAVAIETTECYLISKVDIQHIFNYSSEVKKQFYYSDVPDFLSYYYETRRVSAFKGIFGKVNIDEVFENPKKRLKYQK